MNIKYWKTKEQFLSKKLNKKRSKNMKYSIRNKL